MPKKRILNGKSQMEDGKRPGGFSICHFPFDIGPDYFSGPLEELASHLKRSSNACRALEGAVVLVSRDTVVRGSNSVQLLRASFGLMRAGIGLMHSNAALVSKFAHWAQACRSAPQRLHRASSAHAVATVSSFPQRVHLTASRKLGTAKVLGLVGGCPRGAYSFFSTGRCSGLGARGSSW